MNLDYQLYDPIEDQYKFFSFDMNELKKEYKRIKNLSNLQFMQELCTILHFSCNASFHFLAKQHSLGDCGIVHELIHLLHIPDEPLVSLSKVRALFVHYFEDYLGENSEKG